jgi:hypothetical protein
VSRLTVTVTARRRLRFADGSPVRSASAVAPFAGGWLVAQDDATSVAWLRRGAEVAERLPLLPPVAGHQTFSEAAGTKRLKPDLEAGCEVEVRGRAGVLFLGSGSLPNRMRAALVVPAGDGAPAVVAADLAPLYERVAGVLGLAADQVNLEGACVVGDRLRWFQRGLAAQGVPSASVDLALARVLDAVAGAAPAADIGPTRVRRYHLGTLGGVTLAVTDAVALPDGRLVLSAGAEEADDPVADGPLAGSALALVAPSGELLDVVPVETPGEVLKIEGLAVAGETGGDAVRLLAVVDQDDPAVASLALDLELRRG